MTILRLMGQIWSSICGVIRAFSQKWHFWRVLYNTANSGFKKEGVVCSQKGSGGYMGYRLIVDSNWTFLDLEVFSKLWAFVDFHYFSLFSHFRLFSWICCVEGWCTGVLDLVCLTYINWSIWVVPLILRWSGLKSSKMSKVVFLGVVVFNWLRTKSWGLVLELSKGVGIDENDTFLVKKWQI